MRWYPPYGVRPILPLTGAFSPKNTPSCLYSLELHTAAKRGRRSEEADPTRALAYDIFRRILALDKHVLSRLLARDAGPVVSPGWKNGSTSWRRAVTVASSASSSSASSESPPCAGPAIFLYSSQSASLAPNVSSPLPLSKAAVYGREAQGRYEDAAGSTHEATSCRNHLYETRVMLL